MSKKQSRNPKEMGVIYDAMEYAWSCGKGKDGQKQRQ